MLVNVHVRWQGSFAFGWSFVEVFEASHIFVAHCVAAHFAIVSVFTEEFDILMRTFHSAWSYVALSKFQKVR